VPPRFTTSTGTVLHADNTATKPTGDVRRFQRLDENTAVVVAVSHDDDFVAGDNFDGVASACRWGVARLRAWELLLCSRDVCFWA